MGRCHVTEIPPGTRYRERENKEGGGANIGSTTESYVIIRKGGEVGGRLCDLGARKGEWYLGHQYLWRINKQGMR